MEKLGDEDKNLPFTFYGFGSFMKAPHFQYYLGVMEENCEQPKRATRRWERVSKMKEPLTSMEAAFPFLAAVRVNATEAKAKNKGALEAVGASLASGNGADSVPLVFIEAMLLHASGQSEQAGRKLQTLAGRVNDAQANYLLQLGVREVLSKR
jgi:hypothetical protein